MVSQDKIDLELLPLFLEEADELYPQIRLAFLEWREQFTDSARSRKLLRSLHTFKGSARMAGALSVGECAHQIETQVASTQIPQANLLEEIQNQFIHIGKLLEQLRAQAAASERPSDENITAQRIPFASLSKRFNSIVQQTSEELNKRVHLELRGTEIELERTVLNKITVPIEHLLRNAIAHGLESPQQRKTIGKPVIGSIHLSLQIENNQVVFKLIDDGNGLNIEGLRCQAVKMGLLSTDAAVSQDHLKQLIFVPGLTTATELTSISGRGMGMDVVHNLITALGGNITVSSKQGENTCFVIRLPVH